MAVACSQCGNTNHPSGARVCGVCGAALPAPVVKAVPKAAMPMVSFPMLVTPAGRRYRLNPNGETLIGSRGCAVTLTDPGIAPRHARVSPSGGGFVIEDLGGGTQVNGMPIGGPVALKPNDAIALGAITLVYQGPAPSAALAPQPPAAVQPRQPQPPAVIPPQAVAQPYLPQPTGVPLRNWGSNPPAVEGPVEMVDGPHMIQKGQMGKKLAAAAALGLMTRGAFAFLPFMGRQETTVWFLRIKDAHTGNLVSVMLQGQPSTLPQLGDVIAVWGRSEEGNILMERGYSYTTDSEIRLKK